MDQAERDHVQHELEIAANELFASWIRRVELLQHDDAPWMEPDQLMPRLVFKHPDTACRTRIPIPARRPRRPGRSSWPSAPDSTSSGTTCWSSGPRSGTSR